MHHPRHRQDGPRRRVTADRQGVQRVSVLHRAGLQREAATLEKPQPVAILQALREHPEGITPHDALRWVGSFRLAARVSELREAGFDVRCDRSDGYGRYTLYEPVQQLELGVA